MQYSVKVAAWVAGLRCKYDKQITVIAVGLKVGFLVYQDVYSCYRLLLLCGCCGLIGPLAKSGRAVFFSLPLRLPVKHSAIKKAARAGGFLTSGARLISYPECAWLSGGCRPTIRSRSERGHRYAPDG